MPVERGMDRDDIGQGIKVVKADLAVSVLRSLAGGGGVYNL